MNKISTSILSLLVCCPATAQKKDMKDYNVVFFISDQHKASVMSCAGDPIIKTPHLDGLAKTGVRFTKMYCASPLSAPSRAALITGTYPSTNGAILHNMLVVNDKGTKVSTGAGKYRKGYSEDMTTWGEFFQENGYGTAAIGKMHVHGELQKGVNSDFPDGNLMGFDRSDMRVYTHFPGGSYKDWKNDVDYYNRYREIRQYASDDNKYNQQFLPTLVEKEEDVMDFIVAAQSSEYIVERAKRNERFVLHVGFEKPHKPWTTLPRFMNMYRPEDMKLPDTYLDCKENGRYPYFRKHLQQNLTDSMDIKRSMAAYYACISEMDEALGRVIQQIKDVGLYDKTIFVYTSDHGEHLYEHGFQEKHCMFEDAVNVPFIISCPSLLPQDITCESLCSLIDVLPSLSDMLRLEPERQWEGKSFVSQIGSRKSWERTIFSEIYEDDYLPFKRTFHVPVRMLLGNQFKYVYTHGMIDQLYDVQADENEMNNLAFYDRYKDQIKKLRMLTLCDWTFELLPQMEASIRFEKGIVQLTWTKVKEAGSYSVWKSKTGKPEDASLIAETRDVHYKDIRSERGDAYWITANWDLTIAGERKENIPMVTESFPLYLPVTALLIVK